MNDLGNIAESFLTELQPSGDIFTAGPIVTESPVGTPGFLQSVIDPWKDIGGRVIRAGGEVISDVNEQLPQMLFDWGLEKLGGSEKRTVQTGPGTSVTYTQAAEPGAAPAKPYYQLILPQAAPATTDRTGSTVLIIVVVVIALMFLK